MLRKLGIVAAVAIAALIVDGRPAGAAPVSMRNPYRSFNISGVNYGSMQWERTHGGRASHGWHARYGGLFFRRR